MKVTRQPLNEIITTARDGIYHLQQAALPPTTTETSKNGIAVWQIALLTLYSGLAIYGNDNDAGLVKPSMALCRSSLWAI
jgi:hypothetical protein